MSSEAETQRPRVLILGGGFAGLGAARELKDADVEVVLIDKHDYHTFQPILYQVATALLEAAAVGHPLRDVFHKEPNVTVHQATVTGDRPGQARGAVRRDGTAHLRLPGAGARREVNFFGAEGAAEHAFPMYTLADAVRLKEHVLEKWEAADRDPALVDDGIVNVVVVGGGPTGVESAGALAELYRDNFAEDYPNLPQEKARIILVEAAPELFMMFKPKLRAYAKEALEEARRRGPGRRARQLHRADAGHAEVRQGARGTHARLGRRPAGESARPARSGSSCRRATASRRARPQRRGASRGVRGRRHRVDHRHEDGRGAAAARLGRAPGGRSTPARTSPASSRARRRSPSAITTRARWRRSAAAQPSFSWRAAGR